MGENTLIEWADSTLGLAWGCTKVSKECQNCYAEELSKVFGRDFLKPTPRMQDKIIADLNKIYAKKARIVFVNSMTDTYHKDYDFDLIASWFDLLFNFQEQEFLILTKRIERAVEFHKTYSVPKNCWIGTSIGIKQSIPRLEFLKQIDTKIRFVSFEPLLEDLGEMDLSGIHWGIVGGESSRMLNPRPMKEEWALNVLAQCRKYNVAYFFKQMGGRTKDKESGTWGSPYLQGQKYLEMPIALTTKESTPPISA